MPWLPGTTPNRRDKYQEERGFSGQQIVLLEFQDDGTVVYGNGTYENGKLISVQGRYTATGLAAAIAGASLTFSPQYQLKASFSVDDQSISSTQVMTAYEGVETGALVAYVGPGSDVALVSNRLRITGEAAANWAGVQSQGTSYRALGRVYKATGVLEDTSDRLYIGTTTRALSIAQYPYYAVAWNDPGAQTMGIYCQRDDWAIDYRRAVIYPAFSLVETPAAVVLGGYSGELAPYYPGQNPSSFTQGCWFFAKDSLGWRLLWPEPYGSLDNQGFLAFAQGVSGQDSVCHIDNARQLTNLCTLPQTDGVLLLDNFTDTDGVLIENHSPNYGGMWTQANASVEVRTNRLQMVTATTWGGAIQDFGNRNVIMDALLAPWDNGVSESVPAFAIHWSDSNNHWEARISSKDNYLRLYEVKSGVWTSRASLGVGYASGVEYWIRAIADEDTISAYYVTTLGVSNSISYTPVPLDMPLFNRNNTTHGVVIWYDGTPTSATIDKLQIFAGRHESYAELDKI